MSVFGHSQAVHGKRLQKIEDFCVSGTVSAVDTPAEKNGLRLCRFLLQDAIVFWTDWVRCFFEVLGMGGTQSEKIGHHKATVSP